MKRIYSAYKKNLRTFFSLIVICVVSSLAAYSQPVANFVADVTTGCTPLVVHFTNYSTGSALTYNWTFGYGSPSTSTNPTKQYDYEGPYTVRLIVTDGGNLKDTATMEIYPYQKYNTDLTFDKTTACPNEYISLRRSDYFGLKPDSLLLDFGDGSVSKLYTGRDTAHSYKFGGTYNVKFITYNKICNDTSNYTVNINGPNTGFSMSNDEACINQDVNFTINNTTNIDSYVWIFGAGDSVANVSSVNYSYSYHGDPVIRLKVNGLATSCIITDTLHVFQLEAGIDYSAATLFCDERYVYFQNQSIGNDLNSWDFGDDSEISTLENPQHIFQTGNYTVTLIARNNFGCSDTATDQIVINDLPEIELGEGWFVCVGDSNTLFASGGDVIVWNNASTLSDPNSYTPIAKPTTTVNYQATVTDTTTGCSSTGFVLVVVQEMPDWNIIVDVSEDTIIVGDIDTISYELNGNYLYSWTSDDTILTVTDNFLLVQPLIARDDIAVYNLSVTDTNSCFSNAESVEIYVREEYTMGVPQAFTPNNDGINDELLVNGWGIKRLIEYKIYNRWGTEIFSSDNINSGWDGTYKGKDQPIDSYSYFIKLEMWDDRIVEKKGTFNLIR